MKIYSVPALIVATICLTIAISDSLAWVRRNKKRSDIAFILVCLSGVSFCLFCAGEYSVDTPLQSVFWLKGEVISSTIAGFAFFWYVAEMTSLIKPASLIACLAWTLLSCVSQALDLGELTWITSRPLVLRVELPFGLHFLYQEVSRGLILIAVDFVGFFILVYLVFVSLKFRRLGNRREARVLLAALAFILGAQILDFFIGIGVIQFVFLLEYAWLATILAVGLRRSNDFIEAALTRQALERTDEELKDSQATLSTIIDSTADMIWSVDSETLRLLTFNRSFGLYLSMNRGISAAAGMGVEELASSEEEIGFWRDVYRRGIEKGSFAIELNEGPGSRVFLLSVNRLGREGRVFGLSVFAQDITERKRAEEQIARSLAEKEVLLREVYHRTKNNMSVIISILRLQSNAIGDDRLKEAYGVSINRILSMSSVHDNLYVTDDLSRIDLRHYIKDLAERLTNSYSLPEDRPELVLEMESMQVTFEAAINCGLIVNELLTNALKYAFPDKRKGRIAIRLRKDAGGRITLTISDDGIGMAPDFDVKRDGHLGLRLITSLAHGKLRGEVAFKSEGGFSCSLDFSEAEMAEE